MPEKENIPDKLKKLMFWKKGKNPAGKTAVISVTKYLLFFLAAVVATVFIFFDSILMMLITSIGSRITGAEVSLGNVETSFLRGDIKLTDLRIDNPDGFSNSPAIEIASLYLQIDKKTLFDKKVTISDLEIRNMTLYGAVNDKGEVNIRNILQKSSLSPAPSGEKTDTAIFNLEKFHLENVRAVIKDDFHHNQMEKFGFAFKQLSGSTVDGKFSLTGLHLTPPGKCSHNMLELNSAKITIDPTSIYSEKPVIKNITINDLNATAALHDTQNSNIHIVFDAFEQLFHATTDIPEFFDPRQINPKLENISVNNSSLTVWDERNQNNIHGFGIRFENISAAISSGDITFKKLVISNPRNYSRNMLEIKSAHVKIEPDSIWNGIPVLNDIKADGIQVTAGFRGDNDSNVTEVIFSVKEIFQSITAAPAPAETEADDLFPEVKNFNISDVSFIVADSRTTYNIHGFGAYFKQFSGSLSKGSLFLSGLKVKNPQGYNRDMLDVKTLSLEFVPESLSEPVTKVRKIEVDGINAIIGLKENKHSNIHDVRNTFTVIFFPLFYKKFQETNDAKDYLSSLEISDFVMKNSTVSVWDSRSTDNLHGFRASVEKLLLSQTNGIISLKNLRLTNPHGYQNKEMLTIGSLDSKFTESDNGILFTEALTINSLHASGEFKTDGRFNMHEATDLLCFLCDEEVTCPLPQKDKEQKTDHEKTYHTGIFKMTISTFSLWDARRRIPLKISIDQNEPKYQFTSKTQSALAVLHNDTATLEAECADITDIGRLIFYFLNNTAESGVQLLKKSGDTGKNFLDLIVKGLQ